MSDRFAALVRALSFSVQGKSTFVVAPLLACVIGCEPSPPPGTGGVNVDESFGSNGRSCGRGLVVGMTDYSSTNIALVALDGSTLSGSFLSSGSTETSLSAPLTGDVDFPSSRMTNEIVLIDRFPASVLSFVDVTSAEVAAQVSVRTGFDANPQDYLRLSDGSALVSRFEKNYQPRKEAFDEGDDLVVIDSTTRKITGRIALDDYADAETGRARPTVLVQAGTYIFTSLVGHDAAFVDVPSARILALDAETGEPLGATAIDGVKNCVGLAVSPDETALALSCSGPLSNGQGDVARPEFSSLVVLEISPGTAGHEPILTETLRVPAAVLGYGPFGFSVTFAGDELIWTTTTGALEGEDQGRPDRALSFNRTSGEHQVLVESQDEAFTLGDVRCVSACGICFLADAGRGLIHRFGVTGLSIAEPETHVIKSPIGLPPRRLGWF